MYRILTLNHLAKVGLQAFNSENYQIGPQIENPDGIILRSFNMHNYQLPSSVQVIGRAGIGVNNIPVEDMTQHGIPVMNTPGANANAVKELVITGMLLACRNICPAWDYVRQIKGNDDEIEQEIEKNKKRFSGFELPGKTLGVIGLGNIGVKVANVARNLGMKVIGYDPDITVHNAWGLRSSVIQAEQLEEALINTDFVTLHVPFNMHTKHLINAKCLHSMKSGAVLLNFARDGIVDNQALLNALNAGKISKYVCDFPNHLFKTHPNVICLPHLGASTKEAEENCAIMIAQQLQNYLENGHIRNAVNFPSVKMPRTVGNRLAIVNANVPKMVAQISAVLSDAGINIIDMINKSQGNIAYTLIDINAIITEELLKRIHSIHGVIRARKV